MRGWEEKKGEKYPFPLRIGSNHAIYSRPACRPTQHKALFFVKNKESTYIITFFICVFGPLKTCYKTKADNIFTHYEGGTSELKTALL